MNNPTDLEQKILKTIIYFDLFNYPLTAWEMWKWLYNDNLHKIEKYEFFDIVEILDNSQFLKDRIKSHEGFYFLNNHERLVKQRKDRYVIAWQKFRKIRRITKILKWVPFVKMIAVCNDLAYFNAPSESDLDFFIITQKKRIWLTRFFSVLIIKLLGLRPSEKGKKDKVCLSIYINEDNLNLEKYRISSNDIHFTYWLESIIPLYDADNYYQRLRQANSWIKKFLPHVFPYKANLRQEVAESKLIKIIKKFESLFFCNLDEKFYRWLQTKKFSPKIKELLNKDTRVVANDQILKFHTNDNREEIKKKFQQACQNIL
jgi:hypothetical protein